MPAVAAVGHQYATAAHKAADHEHKEVDKAVPAHIIVNAQSNECKRRRATTMHSRSCARNLTIHSCHAHAPLPEMYYPGIALGGGVGGGGCGCLSDCIQCLQVYWQ